MRRWFGVGQAGFLKRSLFTADRRGALQDHRSCLFSHVSRIRDLLRRHFPWAPVKCLAESVAPWIPAPAWTLDPLRLLGGLVPEGQGGALPHVHHSEAASLSTNLKAPCRLGQVDSFPPYQYARQVQVQRTRQRGQAGTRGYQEESHRQ